MKHGKDAVPYRPQSLAALRERLPEAIAEAYVLVGHFHCGLRLIVSRDHFEDEDPPERGIHVSASLIADGGPMYKRLMAIAQRSGPEAADRSFQQEALIGWHGLSNGRHGEPVLVAVSEEKHVPHWMIYEETGAGR